MKALIPFLFLLCSCSSYVQSIHRQIDNEEQARRMALMKKAQIHYGDQRPIQNPVTLHGTPSANNNRNYMPNVRRNYNSQGVRRYKADDLVDNESDGSLWSGNNSESFLFVNNNLKRKGDIVIIEVMKELKEKIQAELKRTFPEAPKSSAKKGAEESKPEDAAKETAPNTANDAPGKVYDKISTSVIEQVNQDYLLIRGRKEIMYKKFKRYFEIQAVVSQKDISSRDSVPSYKLLEPRINILRY